MRFVIINHLVKASKRLRPSIELSGPSDDNSQPKRRDRTGLILLLCALAIIITVTLLA